MPGGVQTQKQTFATHLQDLRRSLLLPTLLFVAVAIAAFTQSDVLISLLQKPLDKTLYYSSPTGGFSVVFQVSMFAGILVALPLLVRQLVKFIEPLLNPRFKASLSRYFVSSILLAVLGVACGYLVSLPSALHFLNSFEDNNIQALISADQYLSFVVIYLAGFALVFQLPLIISIINRITPLKPRKLLAKFKYVLIAAFVVAAILTPTPDVVNQVIFAAPILVLYLVSIAMVAFTNRKLTSAEAEEPEPIPLPKTRTQPAPVVVPLPATPAPVYGFDIAKPSTKMVGQHG